MQPPQRFGVLEAQKCNPYSVLGPLGSKTLTPTAFWSPWETKMQPLQRFGAIDAQKCNPYSVLNPLGSKTATPTAFWSPWEAKVQPLQRFGGPGVQKGNPYNVFDPPLLAPKGGGLRRPPPSLGSPLGPPGRETL